MLSFYCVVPIDDPLELQVPVEMPIQNKNVTEMLCITIRKNVSHH